MKKNILIFSAVAACTMLFAGCSSEEGPSELDMLIEQLQTTHLTDSPEAGDETEEAIPYKSLIGSVSSYSEGEIVVKSEGKEQKFKIDENTQILGGDPALAKTVTITYCEPEKKSRGVTADVITILEMTEVNTENTDTEPMEASETASNETVSETVSDTISETASEAVPEETTEEGSEAVSENPTDTATESSESSTPTESESDTDTLTETETEPEAAETQAET